jgi:hypothetical protein
VEDKRVNWYVVEVALDVLLKLSREEAVPLFEAELSVDRSALPQDLVGGRPGSPRHNWEPSW